MNLEGGNLWISFFNRFESVGPFIVESVPRQSWLCSNCLNCWSFDFVGKWVEVRANFGVGLRFSENNDLRFFQIRIQKPVKYLRWSFLETMNYFRKKLDLRHLARIIHKIFETNSSFHVKQRTTGKVQLLFFRRFCLVLIKFLFQEED